MSGTVIRILEPTQYDFTSVGSANALVVPVATRIDASQYRQADLIVRVVATTWSSTSDDIAVLVAPDPADPSMPGQYFDLQSNPYLVTSINPTTKNPPPAEPYGMFYPIANAIGTFSPLLQVALMATHASGNPLQIALYMDLALKD